MIRAGLAGAAALVAVATPAAAEERRLLLTGFERVRVEGPYEVTVAEGPSASVIVIGDPRAIDAAGVRVNGTTLVVSGRGTVAGGGAMPTVRVTVPVLRTASVAGGGRLTAARLSGGTVSVLVSGAGGVTVGDVRADRLDATLLGTGTMTLAGRALSARIQANGAGAIDARGLAVRNLTVTSQGSSELQLAARDTAQVIADGPGTIVVAGTPACTVRGSAPVRCGTAAR